MSSERSRQIEALYHAARQATPDERAALLAQADAEVRHEVELLLSNRNQGEFLDRPAVHAIYPLEETVAYTRVTISRRRCRSRLARAWVRTASKTSSAPAAWERSFAGWIRVWAGPSPSRSLTSGSAPGSNAR